VELCLSLRKGGVELASLGLCKGELALIFYLPYKTLFMQLLSSLFTCLS
jgi:hypothetical protein